MEHRSKNLENPELFGKLHTVSFSCLCYVMMCALFGFEFVFHTRACCFLLCGVCREHCFLRFYLLVLLNVVHLLYSLSGMVHLNCSLNGTRFNETKTSCIIAHNLCILLMNTNCIAIFFSSILVMSVQISIRYCYNSDCRLKCSCCFATNLWRL